MQLLLSFTYILTIALFAGVCVCVCVCACVCLCVCVCARLSHKKLYEGFQTLLDIFPYLLLAAFGASIGLVNVTFLEN